MAKENIINNASDGYGYKYASLADIAKQGQVIPKMIVRIIEGKEYVFYFDKELNDWMQGARIVIPAAKGMNDAQVYGAALTYARRYTVLMSNGLACGDDKDIEDIARNGFKKGPISEKQIGYIKSLFASDKENFTNMLKCYQVDRVEDLDASQANEIIQHAKKRTV